MRFYYAYVHGFASGPQSYKGRVLHKWFKERHGIDLFLANINGGEDYRGITVTRAVAELKRLDEEEITRSEGKPFTWRLIGSSMGGLVIARFAELYPERVDSLVALCPAFDFKNNLRTWVGEAEFDDWLSKGVRDWVAPSHGETIPVKSDLLLDLDNHPAFPRPFCRVLLIHGESDEVIPFACSKHFAHDTAPETSKLVPLPDDHSLATEESLVAIEREIAEFWGL